MSSVRASGNEFVGVCQPATREKTRHEGSSVGHQISSYRALITFIQVAWYTQVFGEATSCPWL